MSVFDKLWLFIRKLWYVIIICAVVGAGLGYLTSIETKEKYNYVTSAKLIIDVNELGNVVDDDFNKYNTAYALFPTIKDLIFSQGIVLDRVCEEYNSIHGTQYTVQNVQSKTWAEFNESSLVFTLYYQDENKQISLDFSDLMVKYVIETINQLADNVKFKLFEMTIYTSDTITISGDATVLESYKKNVLTNYGEIYKSVETNLSSNPSTQNEYVQEKDIINGLSIINNDNGSISFTYKGSSEIVAEEVIKYLVSAEKLQSLTAVGEIKFTKERIQDKYCVEQLIEGGSNKGQNILIFTFLGIFVSIVMLCVIHLIIEEEKKVKAIKTTVPNSEEKSE